MVCSKCGIATSREHPMCDEDDLCVINTGIKYPICHRCLESLKICSQCSLPVLNLPCGCKPHEYCDKCCLDDEIHEAINSFDPLHRMQAEHDFFILPTNSIIVRTNSLQ